MYKLVKLMECNVFIMLQHWVSKHYTIFFLEKKSFFNHKEFQILLDEIYSEKVNLSECLPACKEIHYLSSASTVPKKASSQNGYSKVWMFFKERWVVNTIFFSKCTKKNNLCSYFQPI